MTTEDVLSTVAPLELERARRLQFAMGQLRAGVSVRDVRALVRDRFKCSQPTAWRIVDMANDLAGEIK